MRLLLVELDRFRSRRAIALIVLAAAVLTAVLAVTTLWSTRPVSAADQAKAEAQAAALAQEPHVQRDLRRCERRPEQFLGPTATSAECERAILPRDEWFLFRSSLSLGEEKNDSGLAVIMLVSGLVIIAGATFAGGDWASGSLSNQLLFEPRRPAVWLAKGAAVFLASLAVAAVLVTAFWVTLYVAADSRGIATGASVQEQIRALAGRGILMAGFGALGGYALTMLLRHTVGTLAVLFGYAVGGEALTAALPVSGAGRWNLSNNVFAWLRDGHEYFDDSITCSPADRLCSQTGALSLADGAAYLGVLLVVVVLLSVLLFRRRDIP
jgi:ABC-2 type transport system permease protein